MKLLLRLGVLALLLAWASGCFAYRAPVVPPIAAAFNSTSAPMNLNFDATELGPKQGKASATTIMGLFSFGDASIAQAARNGNIKTVKHADSDLLNVFGIYASHTTIVYGE